MSSNSHYFLLFLALLPLLGDGFQFPASPPDVTQNATLEYIDPTLPPLLPDQPPTCSLLVLQEVFADTVGLPPATANYSPPPDCPAPWSRIVLELSGSASDVQRDRIAAVWIGGAEVLRTSTPFPMSPGVFWRVRKDVTRYTTLLRGSPGGTPLSMLLENSNTTAFPGVYSVNVSLHFYRGAVCAATERGCGLSAHPTIKGLYREPADMIIPIANEFGDCFGGGGYWLRVENETDVQAAAVLIPNNTYRAVMEIYASAHVDDEYWYANPLRSTASSERDSLASAQPNGGFRQVVLTIDGRYAGGVVPFPVIYPGSINPFFWAPVAAISAYDHPSYDLDITPFVGLLLKGQRHEFGLGVKDAQPHWLLGANLHLWLDQWSDGVEGALVRYKVPPLRLNRQADWRDSVGKSAINGQVIVRFAGWVSSSKGNITTSIRHRLKFKSHVEVQARGAVKRVEMESKARTNMLVKRRHAVVGRVAVETEAPMMIETSSGNGGGGSVFERTRVVHALMETRSVAANGEALSSAMADRQEAEGSVLTEDGGAGMVVWGSGDAKSTYKFRDDKACYLRTVVMVGGKLEDDVESPSCIAVASSEDGRRPARSG